VQSSLYDETSKETVSPYVIRNIHYLNFSHAWGMVLYNGVGIMRATTN
jgi:hypothetical protein